MAKSKTFIKEVAAQILDDGNIDEAIVIFPNRRAGLFFRQALSKLIDKPVYMPEVFSLEDFLTQYSPLKKIEPLEAIFELYEVYKKLQKNSEPFDKFFFWGEMILRDFDEIDQYLVDTKHLFTSIKSQKELDEAFYFLDEEDKKIIQSFWSNFLPDTTSTQDSFLRTWEVLKPLYDGFKERLENQGKAYGGMIYRNIASKLEEDKVKTDKKLYFAGYNALTKSEERILKYFVRECGAEIIWDVDEYYFKNYQQEAGTFLREYSKDTILGKSFPKEAPGQIRSEKKMTATGVSLEVGQAKAVGEAIKEITNSPDFEPNKTVIVLPQEHMLFPVLHSIPDAVEKVNITMGYPLKDTSIYSLLESALDLQRLSKPSEVHGLGFYHQPVQELLMHPLLMPMEEQKAEEWLVEIKKKNRIIIRESELEFKNELFAYIFSLEEDPLHYVLTILKGLHTYWSEKDRQLEVEFISRFYEQLGKIEEMIGEKSSELKYDFFTALFKRMARSFKVPFTGEPLDGLQIMGILETRNLDFERVYILNMNEGSWPAQPRQGSFIPFNIRKAFAMPVYANNDAMYAYLFYRLLQRADEVNFYYNTVSEFNVNGEISRFVKQLEQESGHTIEKKILANPIKTQSINEIDIEKSPQVLARLSRFTENYSGIDQSKLAPSAIITYLTCRLKFYFKYVAKLYEADEVQEEMDAAVFGNILHNTMESLYKDFTKKEKRDVINANDIWLLKTGVRGTLQKTFAKHHNVKKTDSYKPEGRSLIAFDILEKFANQIIDHDEKYVPFKVLGLEASAREGYSQSMPININEEQVNVQIKGIIDRIDFKEGKVRVIDYKTGKDEKEYTSIEDFKDRDNIFKNKTALQVFYYSYLYWKKHGDEHIIEPGIFNSKELFKEDFTWRLHKKGSKAELYDFRPMADGFEDFLREVLTEIFNPEVSFDQVEDEKVCEYCPYIGICGR